MATGEKPLAWLHGQIKTPPFSKEARVEAGYLLGRCHELRIQDKDHTWRIVYRIDPDAIVILEVFAKATKETPREVIDTCKRRLKAYDSVG